VTGYDQFETEGLRLLAAGRPEAVTAAVDASGRRDLIADLLRADAQVRQLAIDVPAIQALVERVREHEREREVGADGPSEGDGRLGAWVSAMLAERLAVDGEPAGLFVARQALDELGQQPVPVLPPLSLRYARARLSRVEAVTWLAAPAAGSFAEHVGPRDTAISEMLSCGFTEEVHVTRGILAGLLATMLYEDIRENHARLMDARWALGEDHASMWSSMLDFFVGISCFELGDVDGSLKAFERIEASPFRHRRIDVMPPYGRAFFRLVTAGVSPQTISGIEDALAEVRRHDPRIAQYWYGHVSQTLLDMGSRAAIHFVRLEGELPPVAIRGDTDRRFLHLRVAAMTGEPVSTDEAIRTVEAIEAFGHARRAARSAVRLGHDLAAGGDAAGARTVHRWGKRRMPPRERCTVWGEWWCRSIDESLPVVPPPMAEGRVRPTNTTRARPGLEIRVLAPTVEVEADGKPVTLSDAQAKLLLALVVAHPAPLHVEQASAVLWPDEELSATRARLNSLVHRLRRVLRPHGDAVGRTGDLLLLDEGRCRVDLWWFQRALTGDPDQRRRALLSVRGNLGDAQFPYDEGFVDERHRLSGEWVRHACRAHRGGEVAITDLEPALTSLKLTSDDLDQPPR
jgi:hypothetical protein